jgi:hypothetical protein
MREQENITKDIVKYLGEIKNNSSIIQKKRTLRNLINLSKKDIIRFFQFVYSPFIVFNITAAKEQEFDIISEEFTVPVKTITQLLDNIEQLFLVKKLRGKEGKQHLIKLYNACTPENKILFKMIFDRDLGIGINKTIINQRCENCIPTADYMGAVNFSGFETLVNRVAEARDYDPYYLINNNLELGYVQEKADGLFAFVNLNSNLFLSRRLKSIGFTDSKIINELKKFKTFLIKTGLYNKKAELVLHGELTIDGMENRLEANGVFKALTTLELKANDPDINKYKKEFKKVFGITDSQMRRRIRYTIWDCTMPESENGYNYNTKFDNLKTAMSTYQEKYPDFKFLNIIDSTLITANNIEDIINIFEEKLKEGKEGTIFKVFNAKFETGHSVNFIKFKNIFDMDLKIVGFEEGKNAGTLGAVFCESLPNSDGIKIVSKVSGFSKEQKIEIWSNQDNYINRIIEVHANDITKSDSNENYSLMHPRFIDFRDDKDIPDTFDKIMDSRNSYGLIDKLREDLKETLDKIKKS